MLTDQTSNETGLIGSGESVTAEATPVMPTLVAQPHGGAILSGGMPGNRGGFGNPKSSIRELCRQGFSKALPRIVKIAEGDDPLATGAESIRAFGELGKYGLGEAKVLVAEELKAMVAEVLLSCDYLTGKQHDDICKRLDDAIASL